jgi:hypothetical protein
MERLLALVNLQKSVFNQSDQNTFIACPAIVEAPPIRRLRRNRFHQFNCCHKYDRASPDEIRKMAKLAQERLKQLENADWITNSESESGSEFGTVVCNSDSESCHSIDSVDFLTYEDEIICKILERLEDMSDLDRGTLEDERNQIIDKTDGCTFGDYCDVLERLEGVELETRGIFNAIRCVTDIFLDDISLSQSDLFGVLINVLGKYDNNTSLVSKFRNREHRRGISRSNPRSTVLDLHNSAGDLL